MSCIESKKILIIRILSILQQYSDYEHPLTHNKIIELLKTEYNSECERKAVGRNISFLREAGYPIVSTKNGVFLEHKLFECSELRLLIDSVLASRHINSKHSKQLIDKLSELGGIYFKKRNRNIRVSDWGKSNNISFFLNVEVIDEAIEREKQVAFTYNSYNIDKELQPKKSYKYIVNPYQMLLHNQRYYLIGNLDKYDSLSNYRVDRITDIEILDTPLKPITSLPDYSKGINFAQVVCEQPYMFTGNCDYVTMSLNKSFIGDIIDWFGDGFIIEKNDNDNIIIRIKVNISAIRYWALQYGTNIEIISPHYLRELIIKDIKVMSEKYKIYN